jgi:hypothetical protein
LRCSSCRKEVGFEQAPAKNDGAGAFCIYVLERGVILFAHRGSTSRRKIARSETRARAGRPRYRAQAVQRASAGAPTGGGAAVRGGEHRAVGCLPRLARPAVGRCIGCVSGPRAEGPRTPACGRVPAWQGWGLAGMNDGCASAGVPGGGNGGALAAGERAAGGMGSGRLRLPARVGWDQAACNCRLGLDGAPPPLAVARGYAGRLRQAALGRALAHDLPRRRSIQCPAPKPGRCRLHSPTQTSRALRPL